MCNVFNVLCLMFNVFLVDMFVVGCSTSWHCGPAAPWRGCALSPRCAACRGTVPTAPATSCSRSLGTSPSMTPKRSTTTSMCSVCVCVCVVCVWHDYVRECVCGVCGTDVWHGCVARVCRVCGVCGMWGNYLNSYLYPVFNKLRLGLFMKSKGVLLSAVVPAIAFFHLFYLKTPLPPPRKHEPVGKPED